MLKGVRKRRSRTYILGIPLSRKRAVQPKPPVPALPPLSTQPKQPDTTPHTTTISNDPEPDIMDALEAARERIAQEIAFDVLSAKQEVENVQRIHEVSRSFLSDTVTVPTPEMYEYALKASLGDDVFHEPCTDRLERHMAQLTGKAAAIFIPSGTMSNQLALRTHLTQPPHSVLLDIRSHVYQHEAGGAAYHSGAATIAIRPTNGHHLTLEDVKENIILEEEIHHATTRVIELENTLNGTIMPHSEVLAIAEFAKANGVLMHLDGARLWHVAAETGMSIRDLCEPFDSVSLCFSKGLGAPIGSMLVGSAPFIKKARWLRKLFGGGMRQTGFMAGAAAYALTHNFERLPAVHALARKLERGLADLGVKITSPAETCMVFFDASHLGISTAEMVERGSSLPDPLGLYGNRLVLHVQTSPQAVEDLISLFADMIEDKRASLPNGAPDVNGTKSNGTYSYRR